MEKHIYALLDVDVEAKDKNQSVSFLESAYSYGITACVLSAFCKLSKRGDTERFIEERDQKVLELKNACNKKTPELLCGAQVCMDHDLITHKNLSKLCIQGENCLLLKIDIPFLPELLDEWIYSLNTINIMPIITELDKVSWWKKLLDSLHGLDVAYQIDLTYLSSFKKRKILKKLSSLNEKLFFTIDEKSLNNFRKLISKFNKKTKNCKINCIDIPCHKPDVS